MMGAVVEVGAKSTKVVTNTPANHKV